MPRTNINYDNTCFYRIVCKDLEVTDFYVGHTTDFRKRKTQHKTVCHNPNANGFDTHVYDFIGQHGGWENWDMLLIERVKCDDGLDARKKERRYIEEMHATLNRRIPSRTTQEYYLDNEEHIKTYHHQYNQSHKDLVHAYSIEYDAEHKERVLKRTNAYKLANKEKIHTKVGCPCGGSFNLATKAQHLRTTRHVAYLQTLIPQSEL